MILRRVIEHVKAQNWTAVALDFVIVVMGVFVGIQLGNWNAARALRAEERQFLEQLRDEIAENDQVLEYQSAYTAAGIAAGVRGLSFLENETPCASQCAELLIDFFHASQVWGSPYSFAKYEEAARLGFPSDPQTRAAFQAYNNNMTGWGQVNLTPPAYRVRVRGHFSPEAAAALWDRCHSATVQFEVLSRDCADDLKALDSAGMLEAIRADAGIAEELRFWIGQNIFAQQSYDEVRKDAARAIEAIETQLGDAP